MKRALHVLAVLIIIASAAGAETGYVVLSDSGQKLGSASSWDVRLADLNGDGKSDAYFDGSVWFNDGKGFFFRSDVSFGPAAAQAFLADLNGDGTIDAICDGRIFLGTGRGGFTRGNEIPPAAGMGFVELLDVNGDRHIDLISAGPETDRILYNDGRGNFTAGVSTGGGWNQCRYAAADFNSDGNTDLFVAVPHGPPPAMSVAESFILIGNGAGGFTRQPLNRIRDEFRGVAAADYDGDGDIDLCTGSGVNGGKFIVNDGKGNFTDSGQSLNGEFHAADIRAADLDRDGDTDLLFANGKPLDSGMPNTVWLNDGRGHFMDSGLRMGNLNSVAAALADLNGDGYIDAVVANVDIRTGKAPVEIWLNGTGNGR